MSIPACSPDNCPHSSKIQSPTLPEKIPQQIRAFFGMATTRDFKPVIVGRIAIRLAGPPSNHQDQSYPSSD